MTEIGVKEVRHILKACHLAQFQLGSGFVSDEVLLKVNLRDEYGLDSLDFAEICSAILFKYRIKIDEEAMLQSSFREEPTVENFIKLFNDYGHYW